MGMRRTSAEQWKFVPSRPGRGRKPDEWCVYVSVDAKERERERGKWGNVTSWEVATGQSPSAELEVPAAAVIGFQDANAGPPGSAPVWPLPERSKREEREGALGEPQLSQTKR